MNIVKPKINQQSLTKRASVKIYWSLITLFILIQPLMQNSFAQDGPGTDSHGGEITERKLAEIKDKIVDYLYTESGQKAFPKIKEYDLSHLNESFKTLMAQIHITIQKGPVLDSFGRPRTCVSQLSKKTTICNSDELPKLEVNNEPYFYGIIAHEMFVYVGIEKPIDENISSTYEYSSKITSRMKLRIHKEWIISDEDGIKTLAQTGILCWEPTQGWYSNDKGWGGDYGKSLIFKWEANGDYVLYRYYAKKVRQKSLREQWMRLRKIPMSSFEELSRGNASISTIEQRTKGRYLDLSGRDDTWGMRNTFSWSYRLTSTPVTSDDRMTIFPAGWTSAPLSPKVPSEERTIFPASIRLNQDPVALVCTSINQESLGDFYKIPVKP